MGRLNAKTTTLIAESPPSASPNMMGPGGARRKIGAYSRLGALALIDGRSSQAQFVKRKRRELIRHCGGSPSEVQKSLIDECCWLALRLDQLRAKMATGSLTEHDNFHYISWSNTYGRRLVQLGIKSGAQHAPSLADYLAAAPDEAAE